MTAPREVQQSSANPPRSSSLSSPLSLSAAPPSSEHDSRSTPAGLTQGAEYDDQARKNRKPAAKLSQLERAVEEEGLPPSYEQTRQAEPGNPRFGRWKNWVEKRGDERRQEREELGRNGQLEKSSWDLPEPSSASVLPRDGWTRAQNQEEEEEAVRAARSRDALMENRLSTSQYTISNPDYLQPHLASESRESRSRSSSAASSSGGGGGSARLTKNVSIERLGSRFDRGLPEKPLCGMMLPTQPPPTSSTIATEIDRFLLVGTSNGLYLVDLEPSLSSSEPLRTAAPSSTHSSSSTEAPTSTRILPLWQGLGVHHLDCYVEPAKPKSEGAKGLLVMLVGSETGGGVEVKMWNIASIVNLVKWRTYNESSIPLDLTPTPATSSTSHSRNASFSTFRQSIFNSPSPKGKGKQLSPDSASFPSQRHQRTRSGSASSTKVSPSDDRTSLPYEWVNASVKLPLPKPHTPILSFQLSRMPPRNDNDFSTSDLEDDSDDEDLTNEQLRRRNKEREEDGKLFLLVATKAVVYLFESSLEQKRSWKLTRELTSPSTPRFMQLVRSPESPSDTIHATTHAPSHPRSSSASSTSTLNESFSYPQDLCLLLGTSHRTVLIRLSDCSVIEIVTPTAAASSTSSSTPLSRSRTKSVSNSIKSSASSTHTHHKSAPSLKLNLMDNPLVKKVQQAIESRQTGFNPAGFTGQEQITLGRRLNENGCSVEDLSRSHSLSGREEGSRWVGSEELIIRFGKGKRNVKRFELLTKGHTTQLFSSPLQASTNARQFEDHSHSTPVLSLTPLYTFKWPTDVQIVKVAHIISSIIEPRHPRSEPGGGGGGKSHLVLIAFTATGLSVQEGYLIHDSILSSPSSSARAFVPTPTTSSLTLSRLTLNVPHSQGQGLEEEEDLSSSATLDFATDSAELCKSLVTVGDASRSIYLYTRSNADYIVQRVLPQRTSS